jgi:hypothetical protein
VGLEFSGAMKRPTFLFIGPDKTGSTWLYEVLRHHPQCWVPVCKDLYFFDRFYDRGLDWYFTQFAPAPTRARAIGELSHDYLFSVVAAERIAHDLPGVRLLTCLRDPVERTFSHYLYMIQVGRTRKPFTEALEQYPELVDNSLYGLHLRNYFQRFDAGQIKVVFFDKLRREPEALAAEIFDFLGVQFRGDLPYQGRVLPAARPRSHVMARIVHWGALRARALGLETAVGALKSSRLVRRALYQPYSQDRRPILDSASRAYLRTMFREDVLSLQGLLDVDLSGWLRGPPD